MDAYKQIFSTQKNYFHNTAKLHTTQQRIHKLKRIRNWICSHQQDIRDALHRDFHKPMVEADLTDIKFVLNEIDHTCKNLKKWLRQRKVKTPLFMIGTRSKIIYEPKGVVLIISPWNFPFMLAISPLISAIAAGNCAVIKPSELSPKTSAVIQKLVNDLFPVQEVSVCQGDEKTGQSLIKLPFDHIFFTGSERVGKIVMKAAAENLASVTLELGGQSPVIVDETARVDEAADRIIQGKLFNAGQSCVAPNTVYVHKSITGKLIERMKYFINEYYPHGYDSPDYTRIVNDFHYQRINALLQDALSNDAKALLNNHQTNDNRIFGPVILSGVNSSTKISREEIFGPILVVVSYEKIDQIIEDLINKPKPLALFIFSQQKKRINYILKNLSSGTVALNSTSIQFLHHELPFGGVNNSGIGKTHGYFGFLDFSNQRAVLKQKNGLTAFKFFRPPYTDFTKRLVKVVMKYI